MVNKALGDDIATDYTIEDVNEETLQAHPELRALVDRFEHEGEEPTPTEALLINVVVRQQNALYAVVREWVASGR